MINYLSDNEENNNLGSDDNEPEDFSAARHFATRKALHVQEYEQGDKELDQTDDEESYVEDNQKNYYYPGQAHVNITGPPFNNSCSVNLGYFDHCIHPP